MTKFMSTAKSKAIGLVISAQLAGQELKSRLKQVVHSNEGSAFSNEGLLIMGGVVLAGVFLVFALPYFKNDIGGGLKDKTTEIFNMK